MSACKFTKLTCGLSCLIVTGCILVIAAFVLPIFIEKMIKQKAEDQVLMANGNFELWGLIPGQSEVSLRREYYLYNLTNPDDFIYNNAKPEFVQVGPYVYNEHQNYTNTNYTKSPNSSLEEIHYNFWQWYTYNSGNSQDKVNSLNMGSLGVWYQAKTVEKHKMALQVFSNMILGLEDELMTVTIAQGLQNFYKDQKTVNDVIFKPCRIPESLYNPLWNDEEYGWKNWVTMKVWIRAVEGGVFSGASQLISEHFHLSNANMYAILSSPLAQWISTTTTLIQNWYCGNRTSCEPRYLAALQITSQGMTMNPPPGTAPTESIMTTNSSLRSAPEMSIFLREVFLKTPNVNLTSYQNVYFSAEWAFRLFNHSYSSTEWMKDNDLLLHVGNLEFIFQIGSEFEKTQNLAVFEPLRSRFHLDTLEQAHVFYAYINYMVEEFATQKSKSGTTGEAFMASAISLEIKQNFNALSSYLLPELTSTLMLSDLVKKNISCEDLFNASGFNQSMSQSICSNAINNQNWFSDGQNMNFLIAVCENRQGSTASSFKSSTGLSNVDIMILCEAVSPNETTVNSLITSANLRIHSFYNCSNNNFTCTKNEIARKQWTNSTITLNPLTELSDKYPICSSVSQWNSSLFPKPFEYFSVLSSHPNFSNDSEFQSLNDSTVKKLLSFDKLFSQSIRYIFTDYKNNDHEKISESFYVNDSKALLNYLKYIMIEISLQGLVKMRTVDELLFGYQDPLITIAANTNPTLGGDPSLNPFVSLVVNSSYEQAQNFSQSVYSGKGDIKKVRTYASLYGLDYSTFKDSAFDGNNTFDVYTNPWKEEVKFVGTDSFCNPPSLDDNSEILIYMSDLNYGGPMRYTEKQEHSGLNTLRFKWTKDFMLNKTNDPRFDKFYMDKWNQAINMTSIKKMPIFVTKYRNLDLDEEPIKNLLIYTDANKTQLLEADQSYQTHADIEPYTGGTISASVNLQLNFEYQSDELFANDKYIFLPILGIVRPGTWSDSAIDSVFGDLMLALKLKKISFIVGLSVGLIFILIGVVAWIALWKFHSKKKIEEALLDKNLKDTDIETNKE